MPVNTCGLTINNDQPTSLSTPQLVERMWYWATSYQDPDLIVACYAAFFLQESSGNQRIVDPSGTYFGLFQMGLADQDAAKIANFCGVPIGSADHVEALKRGDLQMAFHGDRIASNFEYAWITLCSNGTFLPNDTYVTNFRNRKGRNPTTFEYSVAFSAAWSGHPGYTGTPDSTDVTIAGRSAEALSIFPPRPGVLPIEVPGGSSGGSPVMTVPKYPGDRFYLDVTFNYGGPFTQVLIVMGCFDAANGLYITGDAEPMQLSGTGVYSARLSAIVAETIQQGVYIYATVQIIRQADNVQLAYSGPILSEEWLVL